MKVRDLEYNDNEETSHWFGVVDDDDLKCHIYIVAGEDGPSDKQYEIMERFQERKDHLLALAREGALNENGNKKLDMDTFNLGAIFVHAEEERFELDLAGSVKAKSFFGYKEIPWNATTSTENWTLRMESQQSSAGNVG